MYWRSKMHEVYQMSRKLSLYELYNLYVYHNKTKNPDIVDRASKIVKIRACDTRAQQKTLISEMVTNDEMSRTKDSPL